MEITTQKTLSESHPILNVAFYKFLNLPSDAEALLRLRNEIYAPLNPENETEFSKFKIRGTILLALEGINGFLAGPPELLEAKIAELQARPEIGELDIKRSYSNRVPFTRLIVKCKKEIIAFGIKGMHPPFKSAPHVRAKDLDRWLSQGHDDEGREIVVLDTRNDYEIKLGKFSSAVDLGLKTFRQFPSRVKEWAATEDLKGKTVVSYCTGGIRCEKAAPLLLEYGFERVYQLNGGILRYFEETGQTAPHYDGSCFVFDYRVALDPELNPTGAVLCYGCQMPIRLEEQSDPFYVSSGENPTCPSCHPDSPTVDNAKLHKEKIAEALRSSHP